MHSHAARSAVSLSKLLCLCMYAFRCVESKCARPCLAFGPSRPREVRRVRRGESLPRAAGLERVRCDAWRSRAPCLPWPSRGLMNILEHVEQSGTEGPRGTLKLTEGRDQLPGPTRSPRRSGRLKASSTLFQGRRTSRHNKAAEPATAASLVRICTLFVRVFHFFLIGFVPDQGV